MPTIELDDGRVLAESNAITWYFADGTPTCPSDAFERAQVLQWLFFEQYQHEPTIAVVRFWIAYSGEPERFADQVEAKREAGYVALDAMEGHLDGRAFFVGGQYSIADIGLYAYTHVAGEGGFELAAIPRSAAWLERVAAQPGHVSIDA